MKETNITPEEILQTFIQSAKTALKKEELSEADMLLIRTIIEVKDQFVATLKPDNRYIDVRPNPTTRNGVVLLAYEVRITMRDYGSNMKLASNRVLVVGQATSESRPENVTVVCCRQVRGHSQTLHHKEMMNGQIDVQAVNDSFNYLMFGLLPSNEEIKHTLH